ncbi:uncharacterized protein OCT59_002173 [Rhizophagus irregularis]|uniref:uncharacterized protein n=1 Tax=Rhizophagus irregularis TaxID=588596 RepID=UPI003324E3A0|nr:hypothetical protein OCT59_002173 [Rhizophagus irregularis]
MEEVREGEMTRVGRRRKGGVKETKGRVREKRRQREGSWEDIITSLRDCVLIPHIPHDEKNYIRTKIHDDPLYTLII